MKNFKHRCLQPVLLALSLMAVCGSANAADNIVEVADKAGTFKTLLAAAKAAGLAHTLQEDGPFTVFAPTDDAFAKLPKQTLSDLLKPENQEKLATILKYHVISGNVAATDAVKVESATTLSGDTVRISIRNGRLTVNDANVISNDVKAWNGVIHVIDKVLLPPADPNIIETAESAGTFKTFLAAAKATGLLDLLASKGPYTVFAPTDDAFAKLPKQTLSDLLKPENKEKLATILKYHVLPRKVDAADAVKVESAKTLAGDTVRVSIRERRLTVNDARVISKNVKASNGIIHVIDAVLLPLEPKNIVETAAAAGNFKTLLAAVEAAGLVETLQGDGPFTVLAPLDEAFAELPHGTIGSLLKPENRSKLQAILKYHVLRERMSAQDLRHWSGARSLQGTLIEITSKHPLTFNKSKVITPDIDCSNGVIHVVDNVLMPDDAPESPFDQASEFTLLQRLNPDLESHLKSERRGDATSVTFCNLSSKPIQVYWIDFDGRRKKWGKPIAPKSLEFCESSFARHLWLLADEHDNSLGLYILDKQNGLIVHK